MATPTNFPTPAVAGQVLTAAYVNQLAGAFRILQVVAMTPYTVETSSSTSTFINTGMSATITPQSASNKVLVVAVVAVVSKINNTRCSLRLMRGVTQLTVFSQRAGDTGSAAANNIGNVVGVWMDSPATTSATTYTTQFRSQANIASVTVQSDGTNESTMFLLEISA